jgi:hypothetical protein
VGDVTPPRFDQDELAAHVALRRRKRGRLSRRRSRRSFWASVVLALALIVGGTVSAATVTAGTYIYSQVHGLDIKKLTPDYPGQNTIIMTGKVESSPPLHRWRTAPMSPPARSRRG